MFIYVAISHTSVSFLYYSQCTLAILTENPISQSQLWKGFFQLQTLLKSLGGSQWKSIRPI